MLKSWMKPLVLLGLLGIILYSGSALNVFNDGHTHSHAHSDGGIAEHHHDVKENENTQEDKSTDEEIANAKKVVETEPKVEKKSEVENEITQPKDLQDQNESKHEHDGHDHKH